MAVKIGLISFAHMHAYSYAACLKELPSVEFVGIADDDEQRAKEASQVFGVPVLSEDDLLSDVQGVVVTTENARHREKVEKAAAAGVHILCEKPLAHTIEDAKAMIETCQKAGVQLMQAFPCRYGPAFQEALRMMRDGQIGDILALKGTNRGRNPGGWFVEPELSGGGATIDHTVHIADLIRVITGDEYDTVYCEQDRFFNPELRCDDAGLITMTLRGGAFATLDCSWSRPPHYPVWGDATLYIVGTKANVEIDLFIEHIDLYKNDTRSYVWESYGFPPDLGLVGAFAEAIEKGEPVPITGEDGLRALEVAIAAYKSAETGEPVKLPLA
ncbi:MAG: Gfo/Idh/MocA family oxidoreductase [Armatimonadetes bacterium]|nr:Gfo/Idh/MocA family oxidoreductase [Armatimonadota bacterium]